MPSEGSHMKAIPVNQEKLAHDRRRRKLAAEPDRVKSNECISINEQSWVNQHLYHLVSADFHPNIVPMAFQSKVRSPYTVLDE